MGKFKKGQKCKIAKTTVGGSNYVGSVGSLVTIISDPYLYSGKTAYQVSQPYSTSNGFLFEDELESLSLTKKELNLQIEKLQTEIEEVKNKLSFLEKTGLDEFDDDEFKAFEILKVIGIDDIQKARQIVKLLK